MRPLFLSLVLLLGVSCTKDPEPRPPPQTRFVYPSGLVHRDVPGKTNGVLYVASANFDRCFDTGSVIALDLDTVGADRTGLPAFGRPVSASGPVQIPDLNVGSESYVQIQSFAGQMAVWTPADGAPRLFVPTRAEGSYLNAVDVTDGDLTLRCAQGGTNCLNGALSLAKVPGEVAGHPRAASPIGVAVAPDAPEVWVTHTQAADSPERSSTNVETYVARVPADTLAVTAADFSTVGSQDLNYGATHAAAVGKRYVYVTGRALTLVDGTTRATDFLVRLVDRTNLARAPRDPNLGAAFRTLEGRGLVLSADESRLYVVARAPDTLLVVDVTGAETDSPSLTVVNAVPLPSGADQVALIPREQTSGVRRGDLVAVTCSGGGVVALFDEEVGQVVAQVGGVGVQPFGLAVDRRGIGARLFASNFGDGRIAVLDIPDLDIPQDMRLVAHLGAPQTLDANQGTTVCQESQQ